MFYQTDRSLIVLHYRIKKYSTKHLALVGNSFAETKKEPTVPRNTNEYEAYVSQRNWEEIQFKSIYHSLEEKSKSPGKVIQKKFQKKQK